MKHIWLNRKVSFILQLFLIIFFTYTSINKIFNLPSFLLNIAKTGIFKGALVDIVAYSVISAEIISVALLIFRERIGFILSLCMMLTFSFYILYLYMFDLYEICGCGGILNGLPFVWHMFINGGIIIILLYLLYENIYSPNANLDNYNQ